MLLTLAYTMSAVSGSPYIYLTYRWTGQTPSLPRTNISSASEDRLSRTMMFISSHLCPPKTDCGTSLDTENLYPRQYAPDVVWFKVARSFIVSLQYGRVVIGLGVQRAVAVCASWDFPRNRGLSRISSLLGLVLGAESTQRCILVPTW